MSQIVLALKPANAASAATQWHNLYGEYGQRKPRDILCPCIVAYQEMISDRSMAPCLVEELTRTIVPFDDDASCKKVHQAQLINDKFSE